MSFISKVVTFFLCVPIVHSCMKDVSLLVDEDPLLVVDCLLTDSPVQTLYLSYTSAKHKGDETMLQQAEILLTDLTDGVRAGMFEYDKTGTWHLKYAAKPNHKYRLDIEVDGFENVYAEDSMPDGFDILYTDYYLDRSIIPNEFRNAIIEEGYRKIDSNCTSASFLNTGTMFYIPTMPETLLVYVLSTDSNGSSMVAHRLCTNHPGVDNTDVTGSHVCTGVHVRQILGGEEWPSGGTRSHVACFNQYYPSLIGYNTFGDYLVLKRTPDTKKVCCITGDLVPSNSYWVGAELKIEYNNTAVFMAISEDYEKYVKEAARLKQIYESSDMSTIYIRDNVYSNVKGALGFFGCASTQNIPLLQQESTLCYVNEKIDSIPLGEYSWGEWEKIYH